MGVSSGCLACVNIATNGKRWRNLAHAGARVARFDRRAYFNHECPRPMNRFRSSSGAAIKMMQSTNLRNRDHPAFRWMLDSTWYRSVAFQRKMSA